MVAIGKSTPAAQYWRSSLPRSIHQRIAIHGASHLFADYVVNEASKEILEMIVLFDGNKSR